MRARVAHLRVLQSAAPDFVQPRGPEFVSDLVATLVDGFGPGEPVTLYEAQIVLEENWEFAEVALAFLEEQEIFSRVRDRLWVRCGTNPDPYRIASRITFPYAFALDSALALHTGQTQSPSRVLITSPEPFPRFRYRGVVYKHVGGWVQEQVTHLPGWAGWPASEKVPVTTIERTLVDHARLHGLPRVAAMLLELDRASSGHAERRR